MGTSRGKKYSRLPSGQFMATLASILLNCLNRLYPMLIDLNKIVIAIIVATLLDSGLKSNSRVSSC